MNLILASSSPRRQQMLRDLGVRFEIVSPDVDETRLRSEAAATFVKRLAKSKAEGARVKRAIEFGANSDWYILAADTVVVLGSSVLGKPIDKANAVSMVKRLSNRKHEVLTGYCWLANHHGKQKSMSAVVRTKVKFAKRSSAFWQWYANTGEPLDKAGSYAAQGIGMSFIDSFSGSYSNVVGLPLSHVLDSFQKHFGPKAYEKLFPCR